MLVSVRGAVLACIWRGSEQTDMHDQKHTEQLEATRRTGATTVEHADGAGICLPPHRLCEWAQIASPIRQERGMRDGQTTSWRRLSDRARGDADYVGNGSARSLHEKETIQVEVRQREGGQTPAASASVPILIVDNDINSADSLELMLHAADYPENSRRLLRPCGAGHRGHFSALRRPAGGGPAGHQWLRAGANVA
jgi:hypothetical protein